MKDKSKEKSEISFTQGSIAGALIRFLCPYLVL